MANGYGYHKRLTKEGCVRRLNNFLSIVRDDWNHLWEGDPSLIGKHGLSHVSESGVDSQKEIRLGDAFPVGNSYEGKFNSLGIVRYKNNFLYHLKGYDEKDSLITNSQEVYSKLRQQFDIGTDAFFKGLAKSVERGINHILEEDLSNKIEDLSLKLKK